MQKNEIKDIFILSCYPNVPEKERLLNETVDKLKLLGKTVLIASHFPIPQYIVKKCDYYIYDAYNMLDVQNHTLNTHGCDYWLRTNHFLMETTITHHASALSRIFGITMEFIKLIGYNYFTIMETDSEYDIDDLKKFEIYKNKLVNENKKLFFFKPKFTEFSYQNERVYETYCFGGFIQNFLDVFKFPINLKDWSTLISENSAYNCFEYLIANKFRHDEDNYLIMGTLKSQFTNSKIDLFTVGESSGLYYNVLNPSRPILLLHNHDHLQRHSIYEVKINMNPLLTVELEPGGWYYFDIDLNHEKTLSVVIKTYRDNKLYAEYTDYVTPDNIEQKKSFKRFTFLT
jgi:hypothetical protein